MADVQKSIKVTANGDSSDAIRALKEMSTELGRQRKTFDDLRGSLDPAYASAKKFQQIQSQVADAVSKGAARQEVANKVLDEARRKYLGVVPAAEKAAQAAAELARENAAVRSSYEQTLSSLDDVYASSKKYEAVQAQMASAVKSGQVSQAEANRVLSLAETQYLGTGKAAQLMGQQMRGATAHTTNLMFQFQDIGMMLAAGQNPLMLAMQQGTQVSGVFKQMQDSGQSAFKGIVGGLAAMVSPMSLVTIGAIAGGAALVQWAVSAVSAGEEADEFAKRLDAARESSANLNLELRQMRLGVSADELTMMDAIVRQREKISEMQRNITPQTRIQIAAEKEALAELENQLSTLQRQQDEKARLAASTRELSNQERMLGQQMQATGRELAENERIADLLRDGISASVIEAMQLAGVDMASPISTAASEAARLAQNLGIAYGEAVKLNAARNAPYVSSGRGGDPRQFDSENRLGSMYVPSASAISGAQAMLSGGGSSGGSGGGSGRIDPNQARIESLVDSLKTEREVIEEWRMEGMELLATANEAELAALGGHNAAKLRLEEEYQERLKGIKDEGLRGNLAIMQDFFGQGAQLMQSGNEKLFKIGKAFAVAQAVVDGISAAQSAWKHGMAAGGPPLAAAYAALSVANTAARVSALQSASSSGAGGGGSVSTAGADAATAQQPLDVRVSGLSSGQLMDGMDVGALLERLQDEAGDRGLRITVAR